jgi:hypothetical protein
MPVSFTKHFFLKQLNETYMKHSTRLSNLMRLSWEIQRKKKCLRHKALTAAWAIVLNEDITIYYLVKRHSHEKYQNKVEAKNFALFSTQ